MSKTIGLSCLIQGDDIQRTFRVDIEPTKIIGDLKKAIKAEKPTLKEISADELQLWKVDIVAKGVNQEMLNSKELKDEKKLSVFESISDLWSGNPSPRLIHVMLRRPSGAATISPSNSNDSNLSDAPRKHALQNTARCRPLPTTRSAAITSGLVNDMFTEAASSLREAAWGKVYPRGTVTSPVDSKEYQFYDFTESCHLAFTPLGQRRILIRPEYEVAYSFLKDSQDTSFIITGQPGIGKTFFLIDLLIRRLEEQKTTAIQFFSRNFLLFDPNGVQRYPASDLFGAQIPRGTWALSDSGVASKVPSEAFQIAPVKNILVSCPAQSRWKEWQKQESADIYLMDLWSKSELGALAVLLGHDPARCLHLAATWGTSVRQITNILAKPHKEADYRREVQRAVAKCVRNYGVAALADASDLNFKEQSEEGLSSKVFFVRPGESRSEAVLEVPTGEIWKLLSTAITERSNADVIEFFTLMSDHSKTRAAADWMFKTHLHAKLSMPDAKITLYDKNCHEKIISGAARISGPLSQLRLTMPPFYWQPSEVNFPGIDSILCIGNDLYAFQATVSSCHTEAWPGLAKVSQYIPKDSKTWHLVFVGLTLDAANSVRLKHASHANWAGVETYICELVPNKAFKDRLQEAMGATPLPDVEQPDDEPMVM